MEYLAISLSVDHPLNKIENLQASDLADANVVAGKLFHEHVLRKIQFLGSLKPSLLDDMKIYNDMLEGKLGDRVVLSLKSFVNMHADAFHTLQLNETRPLHWRLVAKREKKEDPRIAMLRNALAWLSFSFLWILLTVNLLFSCLHWIA